MMPTSAPSPRLHLRHSVSLACQVVRERDFTLLGERTLDVSAAGMLVPTGKDVELGDKLLVTFRLPGDLDVWYDAEATVRRIEHGRRPTDRWRAVGLSFDTLSPLARLLLRGHVRRLPPPLPRRPLRSHAARALEALVS